MCKAEQKNQHHVRKSTSMEDKAAEIQPCLKLCVWTHSIKLFITFSQTKAVRRLADAAVEQFIENHSNLNHISLSLCGYSALFESHSCLMDLRSSYSH